MTKQLITFKYKIQTNEVTRQTKDGKEFVVVPVVLIVEGVLNGNFLTASEIAKVNWDGIPITLGHPVDFESGQFISARNPHVLTESPGTFENSKVKDNKLVGEFWFDIQKTEKIGGEALLAMSMFESGEIVEVSSAFFFQEFDDTPGIFHGESFEGTPSNFTPDHAAILIHDIGACSINDGCGAGDIAINKGGKMTKELSAQSLLNEMKAKSKALLLVNELSLTEQDQAVWVAFHDEFGWEGFSMSPLIFKNKIISRKDGDFVQSSYSVSKDGAISFGKLVQVDITTKPTPETNNDQGVLTKIENLIKKLLTQNKEGIKVDKKEKLVSDILACEDQSLTKETLEVMSEDELIGHLEAVSTTAPVHNPVLGMASNAGDGGETAPASTSPDEAPEWFKPFGDMVAANNEAIAEIKADQHQVTQADRDALVTRIMTNAVYDESDLPVLNGLPLSHLTKMANAVAPILQANYALGAGAAPFGQAEEWESLPVAKKEEAK